VEGKLGFDNENNSNIDGGQHKLPNSKEFACGLASKQIEYDPNKNLQLWKQLLDLGKSLSCWRSSIVHCTIHCVSLFEELANLSDLNDIIEQGKKKLAEEKVIIEADLAQSFVVGRVVVLFC